MLSKTSKVAGSQVDLKPVKIEAPKILNRPIPASNGTKSQRLLEVESQLLDTTQLSTIQAQSSYRSNTNKVDNYSTLPRLVLTSLCAPETEEKAGSTSDFNDYYGVSLDKVITFGGENYNPNLNSDLHYDFQDCISSESLASKEQGKIKIPERKSKSSPKSKKNYRSVNPSDLPDQSKNKVQSVDEKPIKQKKKTARPKSQRIFKAESKPHLLARHVQQITAIKELEEEHLCSTGQPTRKMSPTNLYQDYKNQAQTSQLMRIEQQSNYTTITSAGDFNLPRVNLSSQFTSLKTVQKSDEESRTPSPQKLKHSPIKAQLQQNLISQVKSYASATTRLETARISNQSSSLAELQIKEFCVSDPILNNNPKTTQDDLETEKLAAMFYSSRLVTQTMKQWAGILEQKKVARQILEQQKQSAEQLFRCLVKQKVFAALRVSRSRSQITRNVLARVLQRKYVKQLYLAFNQYKTYTLIRRAQQHHQIRLTLSAFKGLLVNYQSRQCKQTAAKIYHRSLLSKSLANMLANRDRCLRKAFANHQAHSYTVQKNHFRAQAVIRALLSYAVYSRQQKRATAVFNHGLKYKCYQAIQNHVELAQQKREFSKLVSGFSRCKLAARAIKKVREGIAFQKEQRQKCLVQSILAKKRKIYNALLYRLNATRVQSCAKTKLAWASQIWLDYTMGPVMNRVWMDFPRQKLVKSDGKMNLLLNYLRIDKRKRYREFYEQVNTKLRLHLMAKVFDHLFVIGARINQFRRRVCRNNLDKVFTGLVIALKRSRRARLIVSQRKATRRSTLQSDVLNYLRLWSAHQRGIRDKTEHIRNSKAYNNAKTHFSLWNYLQKKVSFLEQQEKMSLMILRSKVYSEYMQRWLHALHTKLKHKQCDQVAQRVRVRRAARVFVKWRNAFLWKRVKSEECNHKQSQKNTERKSEVFEQLRLFAEKQQQKKIMTQGARQQYTYKLGRRVYSSLVRNWNECAAKNNLLDLLQIRIRTKCSAQVFQAMRSYTVYKRQNRRAAHLQTKQLAAQIKQRLLDKWHKCYQRRVSARLLAIDLIKIQKRISFSKLVQNSEQVEENQASMNRLKKTQVFQALANLIKRKQKIDSLLKHFIHGKINRVFSQWRAKKTNADRLRQLIRRVNQHNIARKLKQGIFSMKRHSSLMLTLEQRQQAKITDLKHSIYRQLVKHAQVSQQIEVTLALRAQQGKKNLRGKFFKNWITCFKYSRRLVELVRSYQKKKLRKLFSTMRIHTEQKVLRKLNQQNLTNKWQTRAVVAVVNRLYQMAQFKRKNRALRDGTRNHNRMRIFANFLRVLKSLRSKSTPALKAIRQRKRRRTLKKAVNIWMNRSEKTLKRVRAALKVKRVTEKLRLKATLREWFNETRFIVKITQQTLKFEHRLLQMEVKRGLTQLLKHSLNRKQLRTRLSFAQNKLKRRLLVKSLQMLATFTKNKKEKKAINLISIRFRTITSLKQCFRKLASYSAKNFASRQQIRSLRKFQVKLLLPASMLQWHKRCQQKQHSQNLKVIAFQKHKQLVMMRSLRKMCEYTILRQQRKQLYDQVRSVYLRNVTQKVFNELYLHCEQRHELKLNRVKMYMAVQRVDQDYCVRNAFEALVDNRVSMWQQNVEIERETRLRILGKIFYALRDWQTDREINRSVQSILQSQTIKTTQKKFFSQWRLNFLEAKAIEHASQRYQNSVKVKCFASFKANLQQGQKDKFFRQRYNVVLAVKVLEGFKQYHRNKKYTRMQSLRAYQRLAKSLLFKGLKAFCVQVARTNNITALRTKTNLMLQRDILRRWDRQLQLKLMRSDAFSNCISLLTRRYFREWISYARLAQVVQIKDYKINFSIAVKAFLALKKHGLSSRAHRTLVTTRQANSVSNCFKHWRSNTKYRMHRLVQSLSPALERTLQNVFNQIVNFNDHQKLVFAKVQPASIPAKITPRVNLWLNQLLVKDTLTGLVSLFDKQLKRFSFRRLLIFASESRKQDQKVQNVREQINLSSPVQLLLQEIVRQYVRCETSTNNHNQKCLVLNQLRAVCALQKRIRHLKDLQNLISEQKSSQNTAVYFSFWVQAYVKRRQENCVKVFLSQTHCDKLTKKAFLCLKANSDRCVQKLNKTAKLFRIQRLRHKCSNILSAWQKLVSWRQNIFERVVQFKSQRNERIQFLILQNLKNHSMLSKIFRSLGNEIQSKHSERLKRQSLKYLRQHCFSKIRGRHLEEVGYDYNRIRLAKKVFDSLKVNKVLTRQETLYSRKFAVFTAWKNTCREQRLLSQYLEECNYQSSAAK